VPDRCSRPDKERDCTMSSMWRTAVILPVLLASAPSSSAQSTVPYGSAPTYASPSAMAYSSADVGYALNDWRRLRQSSGYSFADYARFLIANPGWPDESRMRGWAEKAMRPGENAATVIAFFGQEKPTTGGAWARLADATRPAAEPQKRLTPRATRGRRPTLAPPTSKAFGRATATASPPRITTGGLMLCSSPGSPTTPCDSIR
jgi:hypothetical protein